MGTQQHKEMVRGRVCHEKEVVGGVSVMACHIQRHHPLQERL